MASSTNWSVIVVTCVNIESAYAVQKELEIRQRKGTIPKDTIVLAVEDPRPLTGSGSATLNALVLVAQHLSITAGFETIEPSVINDSRILIIHMGRQSPSFPCGSAFVTLPIQLSTKDHLNALQSGLCCNIDLLLHTLSDRICVGSPPGVWVTSCDLILTVPEMIEIDWSSSVGVLVISVPLLLEYAKSHHIIKIGEEGTVDDIFHLPTEEELEGCLLDDGKVPVLSEITFLPQDISERFLHLCTDQQLENCTFVSLDRGAQPIAISFQFDVLLSMTKDVTKEDFVSGVRSTSNEGRKNMNHTNPQSPISLDDIKAVREMLWDELRDVPLETIFIKDAVVYSYPDGTSYYQTLRKFSTSMRNNIPTPRITLATAVSKAIVSDETLEINSVLNGDIQTGTNTVFMHCNLQGNFSVGSDCFLTGLDKRFEVIGKRITIPSKTLVQTIRLKESSETVCGGSSVMTIAFGMDDDLTTPYTEIGSSFCNKTWDELFQRTGIKPTDLWTEDNLESPPCLLRAKLFPICEVTDNLNDCSILSWLIGCPMDNSSHLAQWQSSKRLSIKKIMALVSFDQEFSWRRNLFFRIGSCKMKDDVSKGSTTYIHPFLKSCVMEGFQKEIINILDQVACSSNSPSDVARTLSHIADVLSIMAGEEGGLRSGPGKNPDWKKANTLLEEGKLSDGVKELAVQRERWMGSALHLTRCARQYEGAEQTLIRKAVMATKQLVDIGYETNGLAYGIGKWVTAKAPARVDLSGGWSDTPPITYEHGGTVTNVAIKIDGMRPIGAKIRKIPELQLVLVVGRGDKALRLVCNTLEDIQDFSNPCAPGALLKSAFLCTNTLTLSSETSLKTQLQVRYGCGFELHTWSDLPHGSGLGTSSILAGVTCAAILRILNRNHDDSTLLHLVIHLEQMLTTGGGWQDQVGGLLPGVKKTTCAAQIPVMVKPELLHLSSDTLKKFAEHTALIYTGKTRLAKYILQDVIRRWYGRSPEILKNVDELTRNAEVCAVAVQQGNLEEMGRCLHLYRKQKKVMASGSEPREVREIIDAIEEEVHGCCFAGAGGGGFLFVITKRPNIHEELKTILKNLNKDENLYPVHRIEVDLEGLTVQDEQ